MRIGQKMRVLRELSSWAGEFVSARSLMNYSGLTYTELRAAIASLVKAGHKIVSRTTMGGGYCLTTERSAIDREIKTLRSRRRELTRRIWALEDR